MSAVALATQCLECGYGDWEKSPKRLLMATDMLAAAYITSAFSGHGWHICGIRKRPHTPAHLE
jgi:hypothetical protein